MGVQDIFGKIIGEQIPLLDVRVRRCDVSKDIVSVEMQFGEQTIHVRVDSADDTIQISATESTLSIESEEAIPSTLSAAIGRRVEWWWLMQNNQGYWDAIQVEFAGDNGSPAVCIQLVAAASALSVRNVVNER